MADETYFPDASKLSLTLLAHAAESARAEDPESNLPRLLRYALAANEDDENLCGRLLGEIITLAPEVEQIAKLWRDRPETHTICLASELDRLATHRDNLLLFVFADVARLLGLTDSAEFNVEHRRVAASLTASLNRIENSVDIKMRVRVETIALGWALLASGSEEELGMPAWQAASYLAEARCRWISESATLEVQRHYQGAKTETNDSPDEEPVEDVPAVVDVDVPEGFVRVCDISEHEIKTKKLKDIIGGHDHVIGQDVPLVTTPDIASVRRVLAFEFPYALGVIDRLLEDLIARRYVGLKPTILVGSPGSGKSRMARRLAELLGGFFWRHDASTADGGVIGGTARRWHSAEPAHPFLAISRSRVANPWVLVEEIEKAATRNDHGRFWDSLLAFLEPETAARYLDPALQVSIDVSHVAYLATANSVAPLPAPLRDRMRVLEFPEPRIDDLPHLLPSVINQLSRERGLDERWFEPLSGIERDAIAAHWHGGSVRRLKSYVEAVWRDRDRATARH